MDTGPNGALAKSSADGLVGTGVHILVLVPIQNRFLKAQSVDVPSSLSLTNNKLTKPTNSLS